MRRLFWHLSSNRWNSAITEYAISTARATQLLGHNVRFLPLKGSPAERRVTEIMPTQGLPDFSIAQISLLISKARNERPAALFCYGGPETVLGTVVAQYLGCPLIRFRGQSSSNFGPLASWRQRLSLARVNFVLTPSQLIAKETKRFGLEKSVAALVLGSDVSKFHRQFGLGQQADRPEMLIFGRFDPVKGHADMIRRMPEIFGRWPVGAPRPRLHICGEPANVSVADLEAVVRDAGLTLGDDVIITAERVADVAGLLSRATLGVVPSLGSEIICRVAQEFLLCGTPVAVSGAGSLPEVIFPGSGFCFGGLDRETTTSSFVDWLQRSLNESEAAKADRVLKAQQLYSLEAMATQLGHLLKTECGL